VWLALTTTLDVFSNTAYRSPRNFCCLIHRPDSHGPPPLSIWSFCKEGARLQLPEVFANHLLGDACRSDGRRAVGFLTAEEATKILAFRRCWWGGLSLWIWGGRGLRAPHRDPLWAGVMTDTFVTTLAVGTLFAIFSGPPLRAVELARNCSEKSSGEPPCLVSRVSFRSNSDIRVRSGATLDRVDHAKKIFDLAGPRRVDERARPE